MGGQIAIDAHLVVICRLGHDAQRIDEGGRETSNDGGSGSC